MEDLPKKNKRVYVMDASSLRECPWENQAGGDTAEITDFAQT